MILLFSTSIFLQCEKRKSTTSPHPNYPYLQVDTVQLKIQKSLNESSGLVIINQELWTHNDSGGEAELYQFDQISGEIKHTVEILHQKNRDWEELTRDSQYVYIGNFGNNVGVRKDLEIFKISIDSLISKEEVTAEVIQFYYPEQKDFPDSYNHNFDCEAFLPVGDSLYLFTKNWENKRSNLYSLPNEPGRHPARLISQLDTRGVITGAALNEDNSKVVLLGYNLISNHFYPFIWELENFVGTDFFSGDARRYNLSITRQTEAIVWRKENEYFISAENEFAGHASLYKLALLH